MLDYLLASYSSSRGSKRFAFRVVYEVLRQFLILFGDRPYQVNVRGNVFMIPASHKLPFYVAECPYYDELPRRLSKYLRQQDTHFAMIDVGANVGDTILACFAHEDDRFLAVEANPDYVWYLKRNCARVQNCVLVEAYCSSEDLGITKVKIDATKGTARILNGEAGDLAIPKRKLDSIVEDQFPKTQYNFLKIDTDGNDFEVISGARDLIKKTIPVILIECDVFDNNNYIHDFSEAMDLLVEAGYETVMAYDNCGYLFSMFPVKDYSNFRQALLYQLVSKFGYYDLLILDASHHSFIEAELTYFVENIPNQNRKFAARDALNL